MQCFTYIHGKQSKYLKLKESEHIVKNQQTNAQGQI